MKRFIFTVGFSGLLLLSGCSGELISRAPQLDKCFTAQVEIEYGDESLSGQLSRTAKDCWELKAAEPYPLEGLTVNYDSEGTRLSMLGLEAESDILDGTASVLKLIADAYENAAAGEAAYSDGVFSGSGESGGYIIAVGDGGEPGALRLSGQGISVQVTEWTETENSAAETEDIAIIE